MAGRRGMDQLNVAIYILSFILYLVSVFTGLMLISLVSTGSWIYAIFRSMSRNLPAREKENQWFLSKYTPVRRKVSQARVRFKNRKIYKYYRCPNCRAWLKLPRHIGEKQVTCSACHHTFTKKA